MLRLSNCNNNAMVRINMLSPNLETNMSFGFENLSAKTPPKIESIDIDNPETAATNPTNVGELLIS